MITANAPMVVTETSVFFLNNGNVRVCLSFRNVTAKAATEVDFTFRFDDLLGSPMREAILVLEVAIEWCDAAAVTHLLSQLLRRARHRHDDGPGHGYDWSAARG